MSQPAIQSMDECPVTVTIPVLWGDQDAFGHVNNTIYFRWFECARLAYCEQIGISGKPGHTLSCILASVTCDFRLQLDYPDTIQVGATVTRLGNSSLTMQHAVFSEKLQALVATGTSTVVTFDYQQNSSIRIPDGIRSEIRELEQREL